MAKKNVFTEDVVKSDLAKFFGEMKVNQKSVDALLESADFVEGILEMFNDGTLRVTAENCLVFTTSDGQELTMRPKRPKLIDLNNIKPLGYDRLDDETKKLVPLSFLTGVPFKDLRDNYYVSDLEFPKMICNFL